MSVPQARAKFKTGARTKFQPSLRDGASYDPDPAMNRRATIRRPNGARLRQARLQRAATADAFAAARVRGAARRQVLVTPVFRNMARPF